MTIAPPPSSTGEYYFIKGNGKRNWNTTRKRGIKPRLIVIHTAESANKVRSKRGKALVAATDLTAEGVADYGVRNARKVSWHVAVDSDSAVWCLPALANAWHCGDSALNNLSLGVEIATQAHIWNLSSTSKEWMHKIISNTAEVCAHYCREFGIPPRWVSLEQARNGMSGLIGHSDIAAGRKSDPGLFFPRSDLVRMIAERLEPNVKPTPATPTPDANVDLGISADELAVALTAANEKLSAIRDIVT